jgi:CYTH domain-containing protein
MRNYLNNKAKNIIKSFLKSNNIKDKEIKKILNIIEDVNSYNSVKKLFKEGYCYNFALILWLEIPDSNIYFDTKKKHYLLEYKGKLFDIDGYQGDLKTYKNKLEKDNTKIDLIKLINKNHPKD